MAAGLVFQKPDLWLPISVLAASLIYQPFSSWAASDKFGANRAASIGLKSGINLIGFFASIGQFVCIFWIFRWFLM